MLVICQSLSIRAAHALRGSSLDAAIVPSRVNRVLGWSPCFRRVNSYFVIHNVFSSFCSNPRLSSAITIPHQHRASSVFQEINLPIFSRNLPIWHGGSLGRMRANRLHNSPFKARCSSHTSTIRPLWRLYCSLKQAVSRNGEQKKNPACVLAGVQKTSLFAGGVTGERGSVVGRAFT